MVAWTFKHFCLIVAIFLVFFLAVIFNGHAPHQNYVKEVFHSIQSGGNPDELIPKNKGLINFSDEKPSWIKLKSEEMSTKEIMDYFNWSNSTSCKLAHDFGGKMMTNPSGIGRAESGLHPAIIRRSSARFLHCLLHRYQQRMELRRRHGKVRMHRLRI